MKTKQLSFLILLVATTFCSCSSDNNPVVAPIVPSAADGFTWKENGGSTVNTAATATFSTQYKTLIAKDASNATVFEINLSGTTPGTYTVGTNDAITYTAVNPYFAATSGNIIITTNVGSKVTGTFQGTGSAGAITSVSGTFKNITVVP